MRKRGILIGMTLMAVALVHGQSLDAYLKLRRQMKISSVTSGSVLQSLVGLKSFEIRGSVQGLSEANGLTYVLFKTDDDQLVSVRTRNCPEWITANETSLRLLVKASRENDTGELDTFLVAAAPDAQVSPYDVADKPASTSTPERFSSANPSRSTSGLRGSIGSSGTRLDSAPKRSWSVPKNEATPIYAAFIKRYNKRLSDAQASQIADGVIGFSLQYGVDARLIMAILIAESGFNPNATSRTGAMGLGQLMPATASGLGINQPYDPTENLYGTVRTIRGHLERYHKQTGGDNFESLRLALAAYNAGSGAVRKHGGVPPYAETQAYLRKVIGIYLQLTGQS